MAKLTSTETTDVRSAVERLEAEGLFVIEWTDAPDVVYPEHEHSGREVRWVIEGSMTVGAARDEHELGPGDRLDIEPGETHWARVGSGGVRYLAGTTRRPGGRRWP